MTDDCAACEPLGPPPRAMHDRLGLLLVRTSEHLLGQAGGALASVGLDGRDYTALALLDSDQPRSQSELAGLLGKVPASVVEIVDGLEARGLAKRERDPQDRRRSVVGITAAGRKVLAKADAVIEGVERNGLAGLDDAQRAQLHELLQLAATQPAEAAAATA